jgi:hypothetical protein
LLGECTEIVTRLSGKRPEGWLGPGLAESGSLPPPEGGRLPLCDGLADGRPADLDAHQSENTRSSSSRWRCIPSSSVSFRLLAFRDALRHIMRHHDAVDHHPGRDRALLREPAKGYGPRLELTPAASGWFPGPLVLQAQQWNKEQRQRRECRRHDDQWIEAVLEQMLVEE